MAGRADADLPFGIHWRGADDRSFTIEFLNPGVQAFAFTFG